MMNPDAIADESATPEFPIDMTDFPEPPDGMGGPLLLGENQHGPVYLPSDHTIIAIVATDDGCNVHIDSSDRVNLNVVGRYVLSLQSPAAQVAEQMLDYRFARYQYECEFGSWQKQYEAWCASKGLNRSGAHSYYRPG